MTRMFPLNGHIHICTRKIGGKVMSNLLFLIVVLLLLSLIIGFKMLIQIWGKKYRYKSTWEMVYSEERMNDRSRKLKRT